MKKDLLQAYKQAPWRTQVQWVGIFLLIVVAVAAVAGLYLFISGRSAATGRRIQNLESEVAELQRQNNDLQTQLGEISSSRSLNERVESLNMRPLTPNEAIYLEVPGYIPPAVLHLPHHLPLKKNGPRFCCLNSQILLSNGSAQN